MKGKLVLGLGSLLTAGQAMAVNLCVDPAGVGMSIDEAIRTLSSTRDSDNSLRLETGVYQAPRGGWSIDLPQNANLVIQGGYAPTLNHACSGNTLDTSLTVLDGSNRTNPILIIDAHNQEAITVSQLTFRSGMSTISGLGGDLTIGNALTYAGIALIENNIFYDGATSGEKTAGGLFVATDGTISLRNNLFVKNEGVSAAAAFLYAGTNAQTFISNNTFTNNSAPNGYAVLYQNIGNNQALFTNNIFWGNDPNNVNSRDIEVTQKLGNTQTSAFQFLNNNFGLVSSVPANNFSENPLFVSNDPVNPNFRLSAASTLIGRGDNNPAGSAAAVDLDGIPRKVGNIDLGSYEFDRIFIGNFDQRLPFQQ